MNGDHEGPQPIGTPDSGSEPAPTQQAGSTGPSERGDDGLRRLQERLEQASEAAERLISEAAGRGSPKPPPAGWQRPTQAHTDAGAGRASDPGARAESEAELLLAVLRSLRDVIPAELQQRLGEALREVLLALRALIDWYLERTEKRRRGPTEVQDIPIS